MCVCVWGGEFDPIFSFPRVQQFRHGTPQRPQECSTHPLRCEAIADTGCMILLQTVASFPPIHNKPYLVPGPVGNESGTRKYKGHSGRALLGCEFNSGWRNRHMCVQARMC